MSPESQIRDWIGHGWKVLVFEDRRSHLTGRRFALPVSDHDFADAEHGDSWWRVFGFSAVLIAKATTVDDALAAINGVELQP